MDLCLSRNPLESFRAFQQRILHEYEQMVDAFGLLRLDATLPVKQQQRFLRNAVEQILPDE